MANKDNPRGFRPVTVIGGHTGVMPTWEGILKSYNIVALGDALYASAGYLRNSATSDKAIVGFMAMKGYEKSGTIGSTSVAASLDDVLFWPAAEGVVFMGQTSGAMTQAKIWTLVDIEGAAGNSTGISNQEVNEDATINKNIYLVGVNQGANASFGTWCEVLFTVAKNKFQARGAMVLSTQYIGY